MKKLLLTCLTATVMVSSFTSCIENEVPDEIIAIYDGQANLLEAQAILRQAEANKENADAAYENARAAYENARAESQEIANAMAQASNAIALAQQQAELDTYLAEAAINAENARIALERAQLLWETEMIQLQNALAGANNDLIKQYFDQYTGYNDMLSRYKLAEINKQEQIINQIIKTARDADSDAISLAQLNNNLLLLQETKAEQEIALTDLEAIIAPGTSLADNEAKKLDLETKIEEATVKINELNISITEKNNEKDNAATALADLMGSTSLANLENLYNTKKTILKGKITTKTTLEAKIVKNNENIAEWQLRFDNYDAGLTPLETAVTDTEAALEAATTAKDIAKENYDTAVADTEEADKLPDLQYIADQTANDLKDAADIYQDLITTTTQNDKDVEAQIKAQGDAQTNYNAAKAIFDADPTGTKYTAGEDGVLGDHNDNNASSFAKILTIKGQPSATQTATFELTDGEIPAGENATANAYRNFTPLKDANDVDNNPNDVGLYFDVEADDEQVYPGQTNLQAFQDATTTLDNANKYLAILQDKKADDAILLTEAKEKYDEFSVLFATATSNLEDQIAIVEAIDDNTAALLVIFNDADTAFNNAQTALNEATNALTMYTTETKADLENFIEAAEVNTAQNNITIANLTTEITELETEIEELLVQINAGKTNEMIAAEELLDNISLEEDDLKTEKRILTNSKDQWEDVLAAVIAAIDDNFEKTEIAITALENDITNTNASIVLTENSISNFTTSEAANEATLARLEVELTQIEDNIEAYTILTTKYKDLLDSLL